MKCSRCKKQVKKEHLTAYSKRINKDGELVEYFMCRECNRKRVKIYRKTVRGKDKIQQAVYRSTKKFIKKQQARWKVGYALRKGYIGKKPCKCGETKVEAHHDDYTEPLKVTWLCRTHHADLHRRLKVINN